MTVKQTRPWVLFASVLAGSGLALSGLGLVGGIALAAPPPAPGNHWCPGDPWNPGWGKVSNWDWNHCHDWQGPGGPFGPAGWGPWGPPPPWATGANLMWNPTANGWGFFNNAVWTPI